MPRRRNADPKPHELCICRANSDPHALCLGNNGLQERGICAQLIPLSRKELRVIAFDGCVATDQREARCDGVMILRRAGQIDLVLVELKNTANAAQGFHQLVHTAIGRADFQQLRDSEERTASGPLRLYGFLVTSAAVTTLDRERKQAQLKAAVVDCKIQVIRTQRGLDPSPELRPHLD